MQWISVDLPAPLGPSRPKNSPSPIVERDAAQRLGPRRIALDEVGDRPARRVIAQSTIGCGCPPAPAPRSRGRRSARSPASGPSLERLRRRYGNVITLKLVGFGPFVAVADPTLIKQVFTEKPDVLHAGGDENPLGPVLGEHSLLVIDEDRHLAQRKLLLPPFHGKRMQAYEGLIEEIAAEEIARWPTRRRVRDRRRPSARITLRAILRAVFGAQGDEVAALERVLPPFVDLGALHGDGRPAAAARPRRAAARGAASCACARRSTASSTR